MAITDFQDIYEAVLGELKIQTADTTTLTRVKQDINIIYTNEVAPFKKWDWLKGSTKVQVPAYYSTGTATVTNASTSVTISSSIAATKANYYFAVDGYEEIYVISAHTAGTANLTLDAAYTGDSGSGLAYKIWTDTFALPTDCRESTAVTHAFQNRPLTPVSEEEFEELLAAHGARTEGRPQYYCTTDFYDPSGGAETESDRYRRIRFFPAVNTDATTCSVSYAKEVSAMSSDGDEPLMPVEDRAVLVYGAAQRAWARERNEAESARNDGLFQRKLARMAGKMKDSQAKPKLTISRRYLAAKRRGNRRSDD